MRVLQINAIYGSRSTGLIARDIHRTLLNAGQESLVAHPGQITDPACEITVGNQLDHAAHAVWTRLFGLQGLASGRSTRALLRKLDRYAPDVIHLHNIHSNFLNYRVLLEYTARKGIPVVVTLHDGWFFTGKCYHFFDIGCDRYQTGCHDCPKRRMDIPSLLWDNSARVYALRKELYAKNDLYIVGCSQWITDCAKQSPLLAHARFRRIYNGVDITVFKPCVREAQPFTVLTMANKWFDPANALARQAVVDMLAPTERIVILGCPAERMDQSDPRVVTRGYITDRAELAECYATADAFLNLTFVDTLPTVNMEAAACGTPVVTYDSGGSGELVDDGRTGYVVAPKDIPRLCAALAQVREGRISREACRQHAVDHFDKEQNYRQYLDLYQMCMSERGN